MCSILLFIFFQQCFNINKPHCTTNSNNFCACFKYRSIMSETNHSFNRPWINIRGHKGHPPGWMWFQCEHLQSNDGHNRAFISVLNSTCATSSNWIIWLSAKSMCEKLIIICNIWIFMFSISNSLVQVH